MNASGPTDHGSAAHASGKTEPGRTPPLRWLSVWRIPKAQRARAEAALLECEGMIGAAVEHPEISGRSTQLLRRARDAVAHCSLYVAYDCLQQIERELVGAMDSGQRQAKAIMYAAEAEKKLSGWRKDAASKLVSALADSGDDTTVALLRELMRNVHMSQQNKQHKIELVQRQQFWLLLLFLLAIPILWLSLNAVDSEQLQMLISHDLEPPFVLMLHAGMVTGFLGGLLSVAFGTIRTDVESNIPALRWGFAITMTRPAIGAVAAVPIVLLQQSGIITDTAATGPLTLLLCFVGGFSERWFISQVDRLAGGTEGSRG